MSFRPGRPSVSYLGIRPSKAACLNGFPPSPVWRVDVQRRLTRPGGASSTGAGSIAKHFRKEDLQELQAAAAKRGPTDLVVYPLHGKGERFPFAAPDANAFQLREPEDAAELYRAILQGVAFVERLSFDYLKLLGTPASGAVSISGGAVRDGLWNQIRADVLGRSLTIPAVTEPAFGMAMLAASQDLSLAEAARMIRTGSRI